MNERAPSFSEELAELIPPVVRTRYYLDRDIPIPTCHIPLTHYIRCLLTRKKRLSLTAATHDDNPPDSVVFAPLHVRPTDSNVYVL